MGHPDAAGRGNGHMRLDKPWTSVGSSVESGCELCEEVGAESGAGAGGE